MVLIMIALQLLQRNLQIPAQVVNQISDINYAPENLDDKRCEFIMMMVKFYTCDMMIWQYN